MSAVPPDAPRSKEDLVTRAAGIVAAEDAEARAAIARPVRRHRIAVGVLWVLIATNVILWVVFPPPPQDASDQRAPATVEQDLRLAIAGTASDVDAWRTEHGGALPPSFAAAGLHERPFDYRLLDSATFEISGADGDVRLRYVSSMSLQDFLAARATPP